MKSKHTQVPGAIADQAPTRSSTYKVSILVAFIAIIGASAFALYKPSYGTLDGISLPLPPSRFLNLGFTWKVPIIGETLDFLWSPFQFAQDHARHFGNISMAQGFLSFTPANFILLSGADGMRTFYNQDLVARSGGYPSHFIYGIGGRILNMLDDDEFRHRRRKF
jgi:hypothetical protein